MVERYEICTVEELPLGERKIIEVEGLPHSIGAFNVDGNYYALSNVCPHQLRTRTYKLTREPKSDDSVDLKNSSHDELSQVEQCDTELLGDEPSVETYPVKVEADIVVLYV
jgi:nitrite reductase/ring-hydroxylating ferredoxin subunit